MHLEISGDKDMRGLERMLATAEGMRRRRRRRRKSVFEVTVRYMNI